MPAHTFNLEARPSEITDRGFRIRFGIGTFTPSHTGQVTVAAPDQLGPAVTLWASSLPAPEGMSDFAPNGYRVSVEPAAGKWPPRYKAVAERGFSVPL